MAKWTKLNQVFYEFFEFWILILNIKCEFFQLTNFRFNKLWTKLY